MFILGGTWLLSSGNHVATHIKTGMVSAIVGSICFALYIMCCMPLIDHVFLAINGIRWTLDWLLLHTTTIEALVQNLTLMGKVSGAGLVSLR